MTDQGREKKTLSAGEGKTPELLGARDVNPVPGEAGIYRCSLPAAIDGEFTLLLECHASQASLEKYCRFVRHPGEGHPYTFASLEFHKSPPGIRLGPWPGWRGIPDFSTVTASCGATSTRLQPSFWGDETTLGVVRMFGRFSHGTEKSLTFTVSDPQIVPRRVAIYRTQSLKARPRHMRLLPELASVHPRLLVTPGQLPELRARRAGSHRVLWDKLVSLWNDNRHRPFEKSPESKCLPGPERLAPEDRVLISALIALVTERKEDIQQALEEYDAYVRLTRRPDYEPLGIDTQSGEVLFILALGYDWLFAWMPEPDRKAAWDQLEWVAGICASYLTPGRTDYGQAHYLGCGLGLLAYHFLAPESPDRNPELRGALDCALKLLSTDGSYPHGINLWIYEFGFLLRWIELLRGCSGDDIWSSHGQRLERASMFRVATLSTDFRQGITFGDPQYRVGGDSWCHFLIASRTGSGIAQWLGERLLDLAHDGVDFRNVPARRRVYEYLFYTPLVPSTPPVAGIQAFHEIGQVTIRSTKTLFTMRSGPPLGRERYAAGEYGAYGHSDPASGSFLIERDGQLIASGPGPVYRRDTALHNVVTFDGQGQVGDSTVWLPDFFPPEVLPPALAIEPEGSCATLFAELTNAYLPHLGVQKYTRSLYVDPERFILGIDLITCAIEHNIEWNVHSRVPFRQATQNGTVFFDLATGTRLVLLPPTDARWETGPVEFVPAYPNDGTRDYRCTASLRSNHARFVWCYLLVSQPLPALRTEPDGVLCVMFADGHSVTFDGCRCFTKGKQ